jgi:membrane-bound metal-dependent hydrolase YbcI (DUF457 family)
LMKLTHLVAGATVGALLWKLTPLHSSPVHMYTFTALGAFFAIVPDFDLILGHGFHRSGFSHSLFATAAFTALVASAKLWLPRLIPSAASAVASPAYPYVVALAFLAHFSHVFLDALTDAGAKLLWPFKRRSYSATPVNSGNFIFNGLIIVLCVLALTAVK